MIWRALTLCLALGACSNAPDFADPASVALQSFRGQQKEFSPRFLHLLRAKAPTLQVGFIEQKTSANLLLERQDAAFAYWLTADGAHIILQSGMLHSTRGVGEGLLASELSQPLALVGGMQGGWSDRFHTYLDGNDNAISRTYRCLIENEGVKEITLLDGPTNTILMTENCRSLDQQFLNFYWVNQTSGAILLSRQWAGPEVGQVSIRTVPR